VPGGTNRAIVLAHCVPTVDLRAAQSASLLEDCGFLRDVIVEHC